MKGFFIMASVELGLTMSPRAIRDIGFSMKGEGEGSNLYDSGVSGEADLD